MLEAASGPEGLRIAREHLPDLVLSDINMPGGDGSTLLHEIRRDPELKSRQVVLMTGRPDLVTPRRGMEQGADDFLVKPVDLLALTSCVQARLARADISWRVEDQMVKELRSLVPPNLPHECFTPLAGIIGLMEILRDDFRNMPPDEVEEIHTDVYRSALRLHRTLRNYLLVLDLKEGDQPDEPPPVLGRDEVEQAVQAGITEGLRQHRREADLVVQLRPAPLAVRAADLTRLIEELVDNACKFSRRDTPVTVQLTQAGHLSVTDEGRGMTAEEIDRIGLFQQFERRQQEQQGLGIGLVLVQKLVAYYGAQFLIKSEPGGGTEARIVFRPNAG